MTKSKTVDQEIFVSKIFVNAKPKNWNKNFSIYGIYIHCVHDTMFRRAVVLHPHFQEQPRQPVQLGC